MARKKIQGITIEIGGKTTELQKSLKNAEDKIKSTQEALKDVNKLLKLDPGNVELLTQKQTLLTQSIEGTEEKLNTLKTAAEQANQELADGRMSQEQFDALQREIIDTEGQLKSLKQQMKDFGSVTAQQVAAAGEKVKNLGDKITNVGAGVSKYVTAPIVAAGAASMAAFREVDDGLDIIVKKTGAEGAALQDMQQRAKNLATSIPIDFATAGAAVGEVNTRFGLTEDALEKLSGKFIKFADLNETDVSSSIDAVQAALAAFNLSGDRAEDMLDILNAASQETGVSVSNLANLASANATELRSMGYSASSSIMFLARLEKNGVNSSTAIAGLRTALKNASKDGKDMGQAIAETQRRIAAAHSATEAMAIATETFGSKAGPALGAAMYEGRLNLNDLNISMTAFAGNVEKTFEATLDPMDDFKTSVNELKIVGTELVETAAPAIKGIAQTIKTSVENIHAWWSSLSPDAQETIVQLLGIAAAAGPVLVVGGKIVKGVGDIMTFAPQILGLIGSGKAELSALWGVMTANPFSMVVLGIAAIIAVFSQLYTKCEWFRDFWNHLGADLVAGAHSMWDGITGFFQSAIDKIKGFFNFQWEWPKIKLPHFSINGKFSLNPPQIPRIDVEWYRKAMDNGMILTSPTIFGTNNGKLMGGGEAGPEAVVGVDSLRNMIASAVSQSSGQSMPRNMTVILELDKTEMARTVFKLYSDESRRVGVRLTGT